MSGRRSTGGGGGRRSSSTSRARSKSTTPAKAMKNQQPVIDLTSFGFSRKKRSAPPLIDTTTAKVGGGDDDDVIEIVTSPTKRARTPSAASASGSCVTSTTTRSSRTAMTGTKIGSGKENPTSSATKKKKPAAVSSSSSTTTTASTATPSKKKPPALSNTSSAKKKSGGASNSNSTRVALLDLTQDSSSDNSMDRKPSASAVAAVIKSSSAAATKTSPTKSLTAVAKSAYKTSTATTAKKTTKATATLAGMADAITNQIMASSTTTTTTTTGQNNQQAQQGQRRGKRERDKQKIQQGIKRSGGSVEAPISIFQDNDNEIVEVVVATSTASATKKARQETTTNGNNATTNKHPVAATETSPTNNDNDTNVNDSQSTIPLSSTTTTNKKPVLFKVGNVVMVQDRTWPGRNDQGGVARILKVHPGKDNEDVNRYDVKYIVEPRKEKRIEEHFIALDSEYVSPEKMTGGNGFATRRGVASTTISRRPRSAQKSQSTSPSKRSKSPTKRSKTPTKRVKTRGGKSPMKSPGKRKDTSPTIEKYFSPTNSPKKSSPKQTSPKPNASPKTKGSPRPSSQMRVRALGLVKVPNPHQIACSTAIAQARKQPFNPHDSSLTANANQPRRILPGAILGRSSSNKNPNFVDLGISNKAAGISREHLKVLNVKGLVSVDDSPITTQEAASQGNSQASMGLSQCSVATSTSVTGADFVPTLLLQVHETALNAITIHRTRRGARKDITLKPGEEKTLRIGDAIELYSKTKLYYCVVGLVYDVDEVVAAGGNGVKETVGEGGSGKEWAAASKGEKDAARMLEFTPLQENKKAPPIAGAGGNVRQKSNVAPAADVMSNADNCEVVELDCTSNKNANAADNKKQKKLSPASETQVNEEAVETAPLMMSDGSSKTSPAKAGTDLDKTVNLDDSMRQPSDIGDVTKAAVKEEEADIVASTVQKDVVPIKKGDDVKIFFVGVKDGLGNLNYEWYFGKAINVKPDSIKVQYDNKKCDIVEYPFDGLEKLPFSRDSSAYYPDLFQIGDLVDAQFQDGTHKEIWYHGRIANMTANGEACDIIYHDGDFESNIPTKAKKIRLIERANLEWLVGKYATLNNKIGEVSKLPPRGGNDQLYQISFADGSSNEMVNYDEASKAVFAKLLGGLPESRHYLWPSSMTLSMAETVRNRRARKEGRKKVGDESQSQEVKVKTDPDQGSSVKTSRRARSTRSIRPRNAAIKAEPVEEETLDEFDQLDLNKHDDEDLEMWDEIMNPEGSPATDPSVLAKRKIAKDFPPGLPNVLWCALNSSEAQTGANFLRDLLVVHESVPPSSMVQKLMDLMKYGPKAEGSSVHFKDPHRTDLASQYVYGLVSASSRLVRRGDSGSLFGPSSWDDIEYLLSQSIVQTENLISGQRLAHSLQLAARGARLLSLMLTTELQGENLFSTESTLDSEKLKSMPTVQLIKSYDARRGLQAATQNVTKCLVRHSKWILDHGGRDSPFPVNDECCFLEAASCWDYLGSVLPYFAWLFCVGERIEMKDPACAHVVKDAFLVEMERSLDELPEMNARTKKKLVKNMTTYFVMNLCKERFATPMAITLGKMIGVEDDLALVGLVPML